jgi:hypothetical protein
LPTSTYYSAMRTKLIKTTKHIGWHIQQHGRQSNQMTPEWKSRMMCSTCAHRKTVTSPARQVTSTSFVSSHLKDSVKAIDYEAHNDVISNLLTTNKRKNNALFILKRHVDTNALFPRESVLFQSLWRVLPSHY